MHKRSKQQQAGGLLLFAAPGKKQGQRSTPNRSPGSRSNGDGAYRRRRSLVVGTYHPKYEESCRAMLQKRAGLADGTMNYLEKYQYGEDLVRKLAMMK